MINGIAIVLDGQTTITATPLVGAIARVHGELQADATLLAQSIAVDAQPPASTSAPVPPTPPTIAPTELPAPPSDAEPDDSDESGKPDKPGKPGKPGKGNGRGKH